MTSSEQTELQELELESQLGGMGVETKNRDIPIVSLSNFDARKEEIAESLWKAASEVGFFQLSDHGISLSDIDRSFLLAKTFFDLDEAIKSKYPLKDGGLNAGWESRAQVRPSTKTADQKESYQLTRPHMDGLWPKELDDFGFKKNLLAFEASCWEIGMKVLSCFAYKLGFESEFFANAHHPQQEGYQSTLRMLHYYPTAEKDFDESIWRAGAHTDFDCLTLLFQRKNQFGLQVCPGKDALSNEWTSVTPKDELITCNIGDMLMRWSDDQLKSTLHRVRMPKKSEYQGSRYSIAFFCQANKPVIIQGPQQKYEPISAEDYLKQANRSKFCVLIIFKQYSL